MRIPTLTTLLPRGSGTGLQASSQVWLLEGLGLLEGLALFPAFVKIPRTSMLKKSEPIPTLQQAYALPKLLSAYLLKTVETRRKPISCADEYFVMSE
ncbi:MAG: hypothetical protein M1839_008867 [Geoglossum umbratile]|nr:MAG: hypothetical protein M1839_008867 [Geoglossum umbratile]